MGNTITYSCADCGTVKCDLGNKNYPKFCLSKTVDDDRKNEMKAKYDEAENHKVMLMGAEVENDFYCKLTRLEETIVFAKKMQFKKIGIATCVGLLNETRILTKILIEHGFEVFVSGCKVGEIPKVDVGIDERCSTVGVNMCNPILQADLLRENETEFNIVMGLCVGHDSLFYKYSHTLTTTLVTKDRVLGHNPVAALYTADTYYAKKLKNIE